MRITIDTKEDDVADIKKLIAMLNSLIENKNNNEFDNNNSGSFANMFGQKEIIKEDTEKEDKKEKEETTEGVRIVEY